MKTITIQDIRAAREKYRAEHETKQVRVPHYLTVDYTPLTTVPDITLIYISGGGPFLTFDYRIKGGPDDGKRVSLTHWQPEWAVNAHEKYNGTKDEYDRELGYPARPGLYQSGTLHISTVMYLRGMLHAKREQSMADEIDRLYKAMDEQRQAS